MFPRHHSLTLQLIVFQFPTFSTLYILAEGRSRNSIILFTECEAIFIIGKKNINSFQFFLVLRSFAHITTTLSILTWQVCKYNRNLELQEPLRQIYFCILQAFRRYCPCKTFFLVSSFLVACGFPHFFRHFAARGTASR